MRPSHFDALKPICPRCHSGERIIVPLEISHVAIQNDEYIQDGIISCSHCQTQYPIIDSIPVIVPHIRKYISDNLLQITARNDFSPKLEALIGDASGAGSVFNNTRHHISSYAWDHYGELMSTDSLNHSETVVPGNATVCLTAGLNLLSKPLQTPSLDIGCAVGRTTFELATKTNGLTLGIDVNFSMLRIAQQVLQKGDINYPLKRLGIIYDQQQYEVLLDNKDKVDFWVCNALALPFDKESFGSITALNVLDVCANPRDLLVNIRNTLRQDGHSILATPYDWATGVPLDNWIGGHAPHLEHQGNSESLLRELLTPDKPNAVQKLRLIGEIEHHPWHVRVHARRTAVYDTHIVAFEKI